MCSGIDYFLGGEGGGGGTWTVLYFLGGGGGGGVVLYHGEGLGGGGGKFIGLGPCAPTWINPWCLLTYPPSFSISPPPKAHLKI